MAKTRILTGILVAVSLLLFTCTALFAGEMTGIESQLSINIGWEQLKFEEHESDTNVESHAKLGNVIIGIEGVKRLEYVFFGIKTVIPVLQGDDEEEWIRSGATIQTNTLEYKWTRVDGFIGYPFHSLFNPYTGLRWSKNEQDRMNFIFRGAFISDAIKEEVRSSSLLLGIRGIGTLLHQWRWNYWIEYFVPIDVQVTNSSLPGIEFTDRDGYALEVKGGVEYSYTEAFLFGFLIYGGRMHWNGSGWEPYIGGLAKWPENDTYSLAGSLNIRWRF